MKKKQITLLVLACVLVAVILLYFLVIAPLMEEDDPTSDPVYVADGEALYLNRYLMMYPEIEANDVISITIKNGHGTFSLTNKISEETGKYTLVLSDYPRLKLNSSAITSLKVYTLNTQCKTNEPLRNSSPETMADYGVTAETCQASYTIKFDDNGVEREHTVYIGDKTLSSSGSYFVSVAGRDVIYEIGSDLEDGLLIAKEDFVSPLISSVYTESEVVYEIQRLMIGHSNASLPFIGINATRSESDDSVSVSYAIQFPKNAANVTADTTYISLALNALMVNFTGDKVVEIDPDSETCAKYGLSKKDVTKVVSLRTFDLDEYSFSISQAKTDGDGNAYYYLLSVPATEKDTPLIIRIPVSGYEFLESDNAIKWVATNSVDSGFTKYIQANEAAGESGVADISIMSNTNALKGFEDKFILSYSPHPTDSSKKVLTVTTESGKYTFTDNLEATDSERKNQFNNFYAILVNYPMPNRFNTMSDEEREAAKTEENLILSIRVTMNDGTKLGYDYYKLDSANVMCEFFDEKITEPTVVFDTTVEHVDILARALKQLINGEQVEKH